MNESIKKQFKSACNAYLTAFNMKHPDTQVRWMDRNEGGMLTPDGVRVMSMAVIVYDIDNDVPSENFGKWLSHSQEISDLQAAYDSMIDRCVLSHIGYSEYCEGAPLPYTAAEMRDMKQAVADADYARQRAVETIRQTAAEGV